MCCPNLSGRRGVSFGGLTGPYGSKSHDVSANSERKYPPETYVQWERDWSSARIRICTDCLEPRMLSRLPPIRIETVPPATAIRVASDGFA